MDLAINKYFKEAWVAGMAEVGLSAEDMTEEEQVALFKEIDSESGYIDGFGQFILKHLKSDGAKFNSIEYRLNLWVNAYARIVEVAKVYANNNPPLTWHFGDTIKHCKDCEYANGRTYRASVWRKWGWYPKKHSLSCHGFNCDCRNTADGNKPNKGHPRRLA